ncbi:MAG: fused response regulator/phosphatase [Ectothiorhodospiraceae bacterium]|nr:fused response regulator/phosphatase [Ectothiorhodospiraceae bacterium]
MPQKILVVDDEPDLQLLIKQNFFKQIRKKEYEFEFAMNGKEALEVLERRDDMDVVLSDINMPVMDGLTLLNNINERYPLLRAVVVSAYGDTKNVRQAMNNGAFDFVTKPIDFDDLGITIQKTLREVAALKESLEARDQLVAVRQELSIGQQIQSSFLPTKLPEAAGWELAAYFHPAREVAGDFYDAIELPETGSIGLVVADVCDKGVGAALFMSLIRSLIRAFAEEGERTGISTQKPVEITNEYILRNHVDANMFATMFFARVEPNSGRVQVINAGHNPPMVLDPNGNIKSYIKPSGPAVGMFPDVTYDVNTVELEIGDFLVSFTDGVTEAKDIDGNFYGEERLESVCNQPADSAEAMLTRMIEDVREFIGEAKQFDDITACVLRRTE